MLPCVVAMSLIVTGLCDDTAAAETKKPACDAPFFELQEPPLLQTSAKNNQFLPAITVAMDGSVLLFRDDRPKGVILVSRSEDGGKTWSPAITVGELVVVGADDKKYAENFGKSIIGIPVVDETTGDVMIFTSSMKSANILYRSSDHGKSWKQENILIHPDENGWFSSTCSTCEAGITLRYGKNRGRLLVPTRVFVEYVNKEHGRKYFGQHYGSAIYSDDHGKTWHHSEPLPEKGTGETGLVELSDGRIYYNSRNHIRPGNRSIAWSHDGGETWKEHYVSKYLPDGPSDVYGCKGGLVRLPLDDRDIVIYTSPRNAKGDRRNQEDTMLVVRASLDGAKTWPVARPIEGGPEGYSWLAAGRKGTPSEGMIYALTWDKDLVRFNLAWIMDHHDKTEKQ
jgi:sialidase-1